MATGNNHAVNTTRCPDCDRVLMLTARCFGQSCIAVNYQPAAPNELAAAVEAEYRAMRKHHEDVRRAAFWASKLGAKRRERIKTFGSEANFWTP